MINNFLKTAIRSIWRNKTFSIFIITGLTLGIATTLYIFIYISYEKSYDNFHENSNRLYRVNVTNQLSGTDAYKSPYSYAAQGPLAKKEIPEIKGFVRLRYARPIVISSAGNHSIDKSFNVTDYYLADSNFFNLFSFKLIYGNPLNTMPFPKSIVLTKDISKKLFGNKNPLGETIYVNGTDEYTITGVVENTPENSHLKFEVVISMSNRDFIDDNDWYNHSFFTYFLLDNKCDPGEVEKRITGLYLPYKESNGQIKWELQNIKQTYLNTTDFTSTPEFFKFGNERHIRFLALIAILVMLIAWINYINLFTAKTVEKVKEVGVRKSTGASKSNIVFQYITETLVYNLTAIFLSILTILLVKKLFAGSGFIGSVPVFSQANFWILACWIFVIGTLVSGSFPAFFLGTQNPVVKKSPRTKDSGTFNIRSALVVLQFVILIAVISFTFHVNKQLKYIQNIDLGFDKEQTLVVKAPRLNFGDNWSEKIGLFKNELMAVSGVTDMCASQSIPGQRFGYGNSVFRADRETENDFTRVGYVSGNFMDFYDIHLISGRSFGQNSEQNKLQVLINESKVDQLEFETPEEALNQKLQWGGRLYTVIGVIEDFHQESLHKMFEPTLYHLYDNNCNYFSIRINGNNYQKNIESIKNTFDGIFPGNPFDYFFLDPYFNAQYVKDIQFQKMYTFFSVLAIILGYLGLLGLITFAVVNRAKEIGIRKVNGARITEVLSLINSDYIKWLLIAFIISVPITRVMIKLWLENFAYKIHIEWSVFGITGLMVVSFAIVIISCQSFHTARKNPVESLRYE